MPPFTRGFLRRHHSEENLRRHHSEDQLSTMNDLTVVFREEASYESITTPPSQNLALVEQLSEYKSLLARKEQEV